jgi:hypothetical protein
MNFEKINFLLESVIGLTKTSPSDFESSKYRTVNKIKCPW